jgi:hypothetical protein
MVWRRTLSSWIAALAAVALLLVVKVATAFTSSTRMTTTQTMAPMQDDVHGAAVASNAKLMLEPSWRTATQTKRRALVSPDEDIKRRRCRHPCPDPPDDWTMDRREALFSTLGAVWATLSGPRTFQTASTASTTTTAAAAVSSLWAWAERPLVAAAAAAGAEAKMELPNPLQAASDRASKQCLVESLGNRECLVYEDPANKLYQGIDPSKVLGRLEPATAALATMPSLVAAKQWRKISSALTGPMGELIRTMGQLSVDNASAQSKVATVKRDLYALQEAQSRKDGALVLKFHAAATNDLAVFVQAL